MWKSERFVGACRRGYSGAFWDIFVKGKCTMVGEVEVSRNYLLTDYEGMGSSSVGC